MNTPETINNSFLNLYEINIHENIINSVLKTIKSSRYSTIALEFPFLMESVFKVNKKDINQLYKASYYHFVSNLLSEEVLYSKLDTQDDDFTEFGFSSSICREEAVKLFSDLFSIESEFWAYWKERKDIYINGIKTKNELSMSASFEDYASILQKISNSNMVIIDGLCVLSGQDKENYEQLAKSYNAFFIADQLIQDIKSIKSDNVNGRHNWIHNQALILSNTSFDTIDEIVKYSYLSGIVITNYKRALSYFQKSKEEIQFDGADKWKRLINKRIHKTEEIINGIKGYLGILNRKLELRNKDIQIFQYQLIAPNNTSDYKSIFENSISCIYREWNAGYGEINHIVFLGNQQGFMTENEIHSADIFQRALVLDTLIDIHDKSTNPDLLKIINYETQYLKDVQLADGGWSYFPTCPEIAPDSDLLGQIIQCFTRVDQNKFIEEYCLPQVDLLFKYNAPANDGSFETWIVPTKEPNELQQRQILYNNLWGKGPDNEVVANLLYGLYLFDNHTYRSRIELGCKYLLQQQEKEGFWSSAWYCGPYYGTYVCLRLVRNFKNTTRSCELALNFILENQREDGGWALEAKNSDPLSTSLAILCLQYFSNAIVNTAILKGVEFIRESYKPKEENWEKVDFIHPTMLKNAEPFQSYTMTTSYVLKAINSIS